MFFRKAPFFSKEQKDSLVAAIRAAEHLTSGEIRVHVESTCDDDPYDRAIKVFEKLKMNQTKQRNGVLLYLAHADKKMAIIGDTGIHAIVPLNFWDKTKEEMKAHFANGEYLIGLTYGIEQTGILLKAHFPYQANDKNELSDEISEG
jgi:uncharacterized membrane protein